jgi:hypothetical protein
MSGRQAAAQRASRLILSAGTLRLVARLRSLTGATHTAAIELRRHDLLHMLANQPDDQVDDALLFEATVVPAFVMPCRSCLLVLHDATDLLGHEPYDRVDDALLLEILAATIAIVVVMLPAAVTVFSVTAVVPPGSTLVEVRPHQMFERLQPFENLAPVLITHGRPPLAVYSSRLGLIGPILGAIISSTTPV